MVDRHNNQQAFFECCVGGSNKQVDSGGHKLSRRPVLYSGLYTIIICLSVVLLFEPASCFAFVPRTSAFIGQYGWTRFSQKIPGCTFRAPLAGAVCKDQTSIGRKKVIVIGAGVGGLCVAGRLARDRPDWKITILEKSNESGGRLDEHKTSGFRFDTGPTLLLAPDIYRQTFEALGSRLEDHVTLKRVSPSYRVFTSDGTNFTASADMHEMKRQLEDIESGSFQGFLRYIQEAGVNYVKGFSSRPFMSKDNSLLDYANLETLLLLREFNPINLVQTHAQRLKIFFNSQKLRDILSFQDLYVGLAPHTAPAIFSLLQYLELVEGVWYPEGGFGRVRQGLVTCVQALGVNIRYGCPVKQILAEEHADSAAGVELEGGEQILGDIIVTNVDLPTAYNTLLNTSRTRAEAQRLRGLAYSSGTIAFYWSLKAAVPGLAHHTIFLTGGGEAAWDVTLRGDAGLPDDPSFYVACPGKTDASACPPGAESMMVLVPVGCMSEDGKGDYDQVKRRARQAVLDRLRRAGMDIQSDIISEQELVYTPQEWREKYGLYRGAAFGLAHTMSQLVMFRPSNRDSRINNLFFVGASTSPGNGVPLVMTGAKMCAARVLAEQG